MKRIHMRRLPIFVELTVFIVCTLVLPLGLVTYSSNERLLAYSEEEIVRSAQSSLNAMTQLTGTVVENIVNKTINFSREALLSEISSYSRYDEIQLGSERSQTVRRMANRLKDNAFSTSMIHSIYFWLQDSDYVISSRNDTVRLDTFHDPDWLKTPGLTDGESSFRSSWIARRLPFEGLSEPSGSRGYTDVITYLYRTTNYTTTARGVLAVNLFEKDFSNMFTSAASTEESATFILDSKGQVISHPDKAQFLADFSQDPAIIRILSESQTTGWFIDNADGGRALYCWNRAPYADWILVGRHSFDSLLHKASGIRNRTLVFTALLALTCIGLALLFSRRVANPINRLMRKVMSQEGVQADPNTNEIEFLSRAFDQIAEQENSLSDMLRQRETGWIEKSLLDLIKGNADPEELPEALSEPALFPYPAFRLALAVVDRQQLFNNRYTPEQRQVMRKLARERCEDSLVPGRVIRAVLLDEDKLAIVINEEYPEDGTTGNRDNSDNRKNNDNGENDNNSENRENRENSGDREPINLFLRLAQDGLCDIFGSSVSIGISGAHTGLSSLHAAFLEADEALRGKLLAGHGALLPSQGPQDAKTRYYYPFDREKHLLNHLQAGNLVRLEEELRSLAQDLRQMQGLSNENILQVYNQLIGTSIRFFVENNIGIAKAYPNIHTVFLEVAWQETLDDLTQYLIDFYRRVMPYVLPASTGDASYRDRIMTYLSEQYRNEIDFQRMSDEIGISYSYVRKIVKDETGKSLLDYVNTLRIQEAKRLLRQTTLSVGEVSLQLGYANAQSLTRFFKKYEGVTPGEFRNLQG